MRSGTTQRRPRPSSARSPIIGGALAVSHGAGIAQGLLRARLSYRASFRLRDQLLTRVGRLRLEAHEHPQFHDGLERARRAIPHMAQAVDQMSGAVEQFITFAATSRTAGRCTGRCRSPS